MTAGMRIEPSLPLVQAPLPHEPLGGYILRALPKLALDTRDLLRDLAITTVWRPLLQLTVDPSEEAVARVSGAFGIQAEQVRAMTLGGAFGPELVWVRNADTALDVAPCCLACVRAGRWDLRWFTGLLSVCLWHRRLLQARCPVCGKPVVIDAVAPDYRDRNPAFGHVGKKELCVWREVPRVQRSSLVEANVAAARLLDSADTPAARALVVDAARTVALLRHGRLSRLTHGALAESIDAEGRRDLSVAMSIVLDPLAAAARQPAMREVVTAATGSRGAARFPKRPEMPGRDRLGDVFRFAAAEVYARQHETEVPAPGFVGDTRFLPSSIPLQLYATYLERFFLDTHPATARMLCAIVIAQPPGGANWAGAAKQLRSTSVSARRARGAAADQLRQGRVAEFWAAADLVREAILAEGVDFRQRHDRLLRVVSADFTTPDGEAHTGPALSPTVTRWFFDRWACVSVRSVTTIPRHLADVDEEKGFATLDATYGGMELWRHNAGQRLEGLVDAADLLDA